MSIAEKYKFYHETLKLSSEEALRLATEGSIREHDLEMKRLEHDLETKRLATEGSIREHDLEMKRLDQGRVYVPTIVVSFVKIAML